MKKALINLKDFIILVLAAIVYLAPITFLSFGLALGFIVGGIIEVSLELASVQAWAVKALSILGVIGMYTYGIMDAKYRLDGNIDAAEQKRLKMAWGISAFCLINVLIMFCASCGWLNMSFIGLPVATTYELKGWNNYVAVLSIVGEPMLTFFGGVLTLQYISDIYPELKGKSSGGLDGGLQDEFNTLKAEISKYETDLNTLLSRTGLTKSDKHLFTTLKGEMTKAKNGLLTIKGNKDATKLIKDESFDLSRHISTLISKLDSEESKLPL